MISIVGGKYTTYRAVAEEVVDLVCDRMKLPSVSCRTSVELLAPDLPPDLVGSSSGQSQAILADAIRRAVNYEMTLTVGDFLFRRTTLGYTESDVGLVAQQVANEMQKLLGWTDDETSRQLRTLV
jgi:glycerol-3-phosphate dehydrogenase